MRASLARRIERRLPAHVVGFLRHVGKAVSAEGGRAFLVGGAVRDLWLGRPSRDLDVVVEGDALEIARRLLRDGAAVRARLHDRFRTATLWVRDEGFRVDLATCRRERYTAPAALPDVAVSSLRQDLARRDFTIHAIASSLAPRAFGRIVDPFRGRRDLMAGRIRALHAASFHDDPTRAFRAARFAARLRFHIDAETKRWIRKALRDGAFARLSAARLRREIEEIFEDESVPRAVRLLGALGLLETLHPRLVADRAVVGTLGRADRLLSRLGVLRPGERLDHGAVGLGILAWRLTALERRQLIARLQTRRRATEVLLEGPVRARRLERRLARHRRPRPSAIHAACRGHPVEVLVVAAAASGLDRVRRSIALHLERLRDVRADVTGEDLLRAGVARGPEIASGLEAALASKLDGEAPSRQAQLSAALSAIAMRPPRRNP